MARFRFADRSYLRFSEETVREHGLTPQHYQLLLAIKGTPDRVWATVGELVNRAQGNGLVRRAADPADGRTVRVVLTDHGLRMLIVLRPSHRDQMRRTAEALTPPRRDQSPRRTLPPAP